MIRIGISRRRAWPPSTLTPPLTIAASKASGPTEGLFCNIDELHRGTALPGYTNMYIREALERKFIARERISPLERRGWTHQELILSPRIIRFQRDQVTWQCHAAEYEQGKADDYDAESPWLPISLVTPRRPVELVNHLNPGGDLRVVWYRLVSQYSTRDLSYWSEQLPAFAAIARCTSDLRPGDEYLAGIWSSTLIHDLLWRAGISFDLDPRSSSGSDSVNRPEDRPAVMSITNRAPTWS